MAAMVLSVVFVMSACYTSLTTSLTAELEHEAKAIAERINNKSPDEIIASLNLNISNNRITVMDNNGTVVFDNTVDISTLKNHIDRPEIKDAVNIGYGSGQRYSYAVKQNQIYYALKLSDGYILRIGSGFEVMHKMFFTIMIAVIFVMAFLYILTVIVAYRLTENILKPIKTVAADGSFDDKEMYDEIKPFLLKISNQNKEISRQMEKIKMHKVRLQAISDNMNEGLLVLDSEGNILSANDFVLSVFSFSQVDIKYKHYSLLGKHQEICNAAKSALQGKKGSISFKTQDKSFQIFYSSVYQDSKLTGAILLMFDVSELEQTEKIRREFTANVSHELKTPLTSIHGYSQIINRGIAKPEDIMGFTQKIEKESSRLIILIDDIIKLSKLDENEPIEKSTNDMLYVANEVAGQLKQKANQRNITINVTGEKSDIFINTAQLTQLIYNLCDNGIKYNKDGGTVTITVSDNKLIVEDTGIGIPKESIDRIFERFFRVDKSRSKKVDGTGLGLSIVKHIVVSNGGKINVQSTVDKGTTFMVDFS